MESLILLHFENQQKMAAKYDRAFADPRIDRDYCGFCAVLAETLETLCAMAGGR